MSTVTTGNATDLNDSVEEGERYVLHLVAPTSAETATVTVFLNNEELPCDPVTVTFTPNDVDLSRSEIVVNPVEIPTGGAAATITVTVVDLFDNGIAGETVEVFSPNVGIGFSGVTDNGDGTYTATLTSSNAAQEATIAFSVNGIVASDTATIVFRAADASMSNSDDQC